MKEKNLEKIKDLVEGINPLNSKPIEMEVPL
jgi:hypothetical protein